MAMSHERDLFQRPSMAGWRRPQNTDPVSHMPYIVAQDDLTHPNPMIPHVDVSENGDTH